MVLHAHCVYWDDPSLLGILPHSFEVLHTFRFRLGPWENAFGYLGFDSDSNRVVIAFRGTANVLQLSDEILHHRLVNETWSGQPGVLVNEYFLTAINDLVNVTRLGTVLDDLMQQHPGCEIWMTGHSLGASLAMIMAYRISWLVDSRPTVYTFGQPRTGNAAFAELVAARLPRAFRLVNDMDPVPHIPLCDHSGSTCNATLNGYYHAGLEMWFPGGDYSHGLMCGFKECLGTPRFEDRSCSNGVVGPTPQHVYQHHGYFEVIPFGFCGGTIEDQAAKAEGSHRGVALYV